MDKELQAELEWVMENAAKALDECPAGDECPIHHRLDAERYDDDMEFAACVTYVGEFVVITDDNPELSSPAGALAYLLGEGVVKTYQTAAYRIGDGTASDLAEMSSEEWAKAQVSVHKYDEYEMTAVHHWDMVDHVRAGAFDNK